MTSRDRDAPQLRLEHPHHPARLNHFCIEGIMMQRTSVQVGILVLTFGWVVNAAGAETRPADFGQRWVRSHPFTLMALTQRGEVIEQNKLYAQAGLNTMLAWKDREGIFKGAARDKLPWQYHLDHRRGPLSDELKAYVDGLLRQYPGGEGILLWDEPKGNEMAELGKAAAWPNASWNWPPNLSHMS